MQVRESGACRDEDVTQKARNGEEGGGCGHPYCCTERGCEHRCHRQVETRRNPGPIASGREDFGVDAHDMVAIEVSEMKPSI